MGELEGRRRRLSRRAERIEDEVEGRERSRERDAERVLREALKRVSKAELEAMREAFARPGPEEWTAEDQPLMRRLMQLMHEVRAEEEGQFPWQHEIRE